MAVVDSMSPNLGFTIIGDGLEFNVWGDTLNANETIFEKAIAGMSFIAVSGNATLTIPQVSAAILVFTGALTANTILTLPSVSRQFIASNQTTGPFSLNLQAGGGVPVVIPPGTTSNHVYFTDGQAVFDASQSTVAITAAIAAYLPSGAIQEFAMSTAPAGWQVCDGSALSRTSQASLFAAIGTTWGAGDGVTTFNVPDFRGTFRRSWDSGKGIDVGRTFASFQADNFASHTHVQNPHGHGTTESPHTHGYSSPLSGLAFTSGSSTGVTGGTPNTTNGAVTGLTVNNSTAVNQNTGGVETTVKNYATLVCIRL